MSAEISAVVPVKLAAILLPGTTVPGFWMNLARLSSLQVTPAAFIASEKAKPARLPALIHSRPKR